MAAGDIRDTENVRESQFRNKVYWFTFLLSILVIWVHSFNAELFLGAGDDFLRTDRLERILGDSLGQIAVPGFFMVSAYLFYRNFTWDRLLPKWKSRLKSIVVPYILWNFLYYAAYAGATRLPGAAGFMGKPPIPVSLGELFEAVVHFKYNPVFWYLYQLIILIALAPVLFILLRRSVTGVLLIAVILLGLWRNWSLPQLNMDALFYYTVAAFTALHREKWGRFAEMRFHRRQAAGAAVCLVLAFLALTVSGRPGGALFMLPLHTVLVRFWGVCALAFLMKELPLGQAAQWMKNNFFLYAVHFAWVRLFNKLSARILPPCPASALVMFGLMPFFMVVISSWLGKFLRIVAPGIYRLLSGGR